MILKAPLNMFNSLHFAIAGQWVMAGVAWVLHSKGHRKTADALMLAVLVVFTWLAIRDGRMEQAVSKAQPVSPVARQSSAESRPAAVEAAYVGSSIGKAYHLPDCFYVTKQLHHQVTFATREDAEASGRHACTNCLGTLTAARDAQASTP